MCLREKEITLAKHDVFWYDETLAKRTSHGNIVLFIYLCVVYLHAKLTHSTQSFQRSRLPKLMIGKQSMIYFITTHNCWWNSFCFCRYSHTCRPSFDPLACMRLFIQLVEERGWLIHGNTWMLIQCKSINGVWPLLFSFSLCFCSCFCIHFPLHRIDPPPTTSIKPISNAMKVYCLHSKKPSVILCLIETCTPVQPSVQHCTGA